MDQPLSRHIVKELVELGAATGTREIALDFFGAQNDSYLRSLWSRNKDASVEAYLNCYMNLCELHSDTVQAAIATNDMLEQQNLQDGASAVKELSLNVWQHLHAITRRN